MHHFKQVRSKLVHALPTYGLPKDMAAGVKQLSDLYITKKTKLSEIWRNELLAKSYLSYFLPLNLLRLTYVLQEAESFGFLNQLDHLVDFGSGPGTADLVFSQSTHKFQTYAFIEVGQEAIAWHKKLLTSLQLTSQNKSWQPQLSGALAKKSLVCFSYALNEITSLPPWAFESEALLILEPSTQNEGRNLQQLRKELIQKGYFIWAPCTHQDSCPLLELSKTDWCHQRIHVELSDNLLEIEEHLPIKNQSLTFSYLLARRTPPPITNKIRVIGDTQYERGKVKQAACRGPKREFLTWLTRHGEPEPLDRGSLIDLPTGTEEKGNEIRLPTHTIKTEIKD